MSWQQDLISGSGLDTWGLGWTADGLPLVWGVPISDAEFLAIIGANPAGALALQAYGYSQQQAEPEAIEISETVAPDNPADEGGAMDEYFYDAAAVDAEFEALYGDIDWGDLSLVAGPTAEDLQLANEFNDGAYWASSFDEIDFYTDPVWGSIDWGDLGAVAGPTEADIADSLNYLPSMLDMIPEINLGAVSFDISLLDQNIAEGEPVMKPLDFGQLPTIAATKAGTTAAKAATPMSSGSSIGAPSGGASAPKASGPDPVTTLLAQIGKTLTSMLTPAKAAGQVSSQPAAASQAGMFDSFGGLLPMLAIGGVAYLIFKK